MRFAYADPVYYGCGRLYISHHPDALDWDDLVTHRNLIQRLVSEWPDGWALSCSTPSLRHILPMTPEDCRVGAWVKPFASFKPNVNPGYCWEPVIFRGGRKRDRMQDTVRDFHSENIALKKGLTGAKPPGFSGWILDLLGVDFSAGDTIDDLFPGTYGMTLAWKEKRQPSQFTMELQESTVK